MVKCASKSNGKKEILPIFLNVEPADVKLKTDLYRQTLAKRQKTSCTEVESWKTALTEVGKIKGWNWKKDQGQGDLIRSVIQTILVKLKVANENVTEHLVGVDDRVKAIIKMLDVRSESVKFLGIHGMGGVGKTTLAKVVFNELFSHFDRYCFLANVHESSKGDNGLVNLQKQLLSKVIGPHSIDQIYNVNDGINRIKKRLNKKKVLIVLDDMDEKEQFESLVGKGNWLHNGSRIIVTTRDQSVLMIEGEATEEDPGKELANVLIFEACELKFEHAIKLFSRHAFRRDSPPYDYVSLSKEVVSTLGNLPLALEITGSSLKGKSKTLWVDTLKKLKEAPPMAVQRKLMITYERLDYAQRQVFLDIACFFVNEDKICPDYMWDDCGYHPHDALEVLFLLSLIKIKDDNTFWMHDLLRDLGREIVRQENFNDPSKRSRVWNCEEALSIMKWKEGSRKIEALSVSGAILAHEEFAKLRNLRFFKGCRVSFIGNFNNLLSSLRWLSWVSNPSEFEAINFHLTKLVILDLSSSTISEEWNGWSQIREASKLKVLNLSDCRHLKRTPDLSTWMSLERLILAGCGNLIEIGPSIGKLELLTTLDLSSCYSLQELPEEVGCLQASVEIVMPNPLNLLPKTLGNMQSLLAVDVKSHSFNLPLLISVLVNVRQLNLSECTNIKVLPNSIGKLQSLVELDLSLTSIDHLPDSIGNLKQLTILRMSRISGITNLPSAIWLVEKLEELDVSACHNLAGEIPEEIGRLSCLRILNLSDTSISGLPDSIGNLKQLKVLRMSRVSGIKKLPSTIGLVEKLEELDASACHDLTGEIPKEIGKLSYLRILNLSNTLISGLPTTMSHLSNLQTLDLEPCPELKRLPELPPSLTSLKWDTNNGWGFIIDLTVREQETIPPLPTSIGALSQQETPINALPTNIFTLSRLEILTLFCENVEFLPRLPSCLRMLVLRFLVTTQSPDFSNLNNLSTLTFYGCSLPEFSGIFDAELEVLRMELRKFRKLDALFQLEMKRLKCLTMLRCEFLPEVLDLSCMKNLEDICLSNCKLLVEIRGLRELESLCYLWVECCSSMERMSDLSELRKLKEIRVENCPKLRSVEGLNHLESLEELRIIIDGDLGGDTSNLNLAESFIR